MPVMVWSHTFVVRASVEDIYRHGLSADRWFAFYPSYAGLAAVEGDWPEQGSVVYVRYKIAGPWTMTLRQEVVAHERGVFIELDERGLRDLWIDSPRFDFFEQGDGTTEVTLTVRPDSAYVWAKPLIWLSSQPFKKITPRAMKAFAASIEAASG
jgi:hypothetical protein